MYSDPIFISGRSLMYSDPIFTDPIFTIFGGSKEKRHPRVPLIWCST